MLNLSSLQKILRQNNRLCNYNYRGERTFVVLSGYNSDKANLKQIQDLNRFEERMFFFLFLLKYKRTKIIYVTSPKFNIKLFDYYIGLTADNESEKRDMLKRLRHIEVKNKKGLSLSERLLNDQSALDEIQRSITNQDTAVLRCYNPTNIERDLSLKLQIPLFASLEKFDFVGTKSGSRKVFEYTGQTVVPGYSNIKSSEELFRKIATLLCKYPLQPKLIVKLNSGAAGRGNAIFDVLKFAKANSLNFLKSCRISKVETIVSKNIDKFLELQNSNNSVTKYLSNFDKLGGIVELFLEAKYKNSPSVQVHITASGKVEILSTHEQILGGENKQKYLGCKFPAEASYRRVLTSSVRKIADWMKEKGMMGYFGIDFIALKKSKDEKWKVYPTEINLRKAGTTHPFRTAYFLTRSKYNNSQGTLRCGKTPIYYYAKDYVESTSYKELCPDKLLEIVSSNKINFNENTNRGVVISMPGGIKKYGRFGAICIGHSRDEAAEYYKKLIRLIKYNINKK